MSQPASFLLSRELVRVLPFAAQRTFRNGNAGGGSTFVAAFDVGLAVSDSNQFLGTAAPSADATQFAVGPLLDALVFTTGAAGGSLLTEFAVDSTCSYRAVSTTAIPSGIAQNISGLRVTGRFVRVTFTNTTAGATIEFGVWIRSS